MKATILLFLLAGTIYAQQLSSEYFLGLSLEDKVDAYFDTYRDGHTQIGVSRFAGYIVFNHGLAVLPLIKERLETADYFQTIIEPKDVTLTLIAIILSRLHIYSGSILNNGVPTYQLSDFEIQWFFDDYILTTRLIDRTVMDSNFNIVSVLYRKYNEVDFAKFGYPFFGDKPIMYCGNDLKLYYEERLGIQDLKVVSPFLE